MAEQAPALSHYFPSISPWNVTELTWVEFCRYSNFINELRQAQS